jgi:phosphatidylglycerol:prolipoprotein diacylglycerol transferase
LPTNAAWKIFILREHRLPGFETVEYYHPLFAYESLLSLLNFVLLLWVSHRFSNRWKTGNLFLLYLFNAAVIRFFLEFLRLDIAVVNGMNINQLVMAVMGVSVAVYFYIRSRGVQKL